MAVLAYKRVRFAYIKQYSRINMIDFLIKKIKQKRPSTKSNLYGKMAGETILLL